MKSYKTFLTTIYICALLTSGAVLFAGGTQESEGYKSFPGHHIDYWKLKAHDGLLIGGYGDNIADSGEGVVPVGGKAWVEVDARKNTGKMKVVFRGTINPEAGKSYTGEIKLVYDRFEEGSDFLEGGLADYVYLPGNTRQEAPVMPGFKADLASRGPVDVFVDGELLYDDLAGHMMYTEGKELHFVAHTDDPDEGDFPPHTVWIQLNFLSVEELPFSPSGKIYGAKPESL
jgi:hypothetical protein